MICPNCGNDTPNEQAFCSTCGAFVRTEFGKVFSNEFATGELQPIVEAWPDAKPAASAEAQADPFFWPDETIFIPTADASQETTPDEIPIAAERAFEDAQADDFFEQSLSGRIKREDLEIEEAETEPAVRDETMAVFEPAAEPDPDLQTLSFGRITQPIVLPIESEAQSAATAGKRSVFYTVLRVLTFALLLAAFFAGGVYVGMQVEEFVPAEIPSENDVPPVITEPARPTPPSGMAYVPGGEFVMGSDLGDPYSRPAHKVTVEPFFMDVTEVTNRAYREFVNATGHDPPRNWKNGIMPEIESDLPVTGITWYEAAEFAAWAGKRLPTETEWEFAARGTDTRTYPWGDGWDETLANAGGKSKGLRSVGQGGQSPFGIYDMAGNAWEWTSSDVRAYPGGKEFPWSRLRLKVIRGGSWKSSQSASTALFRGYYGAAGEREYSGTSFRCVKDLTGDE